MVGVDAAPNYIVILYENMANNKLVLTRATLDIYFL